MLPAADNIFVVRSIDPRSRVLEEGVLDISVERNSQGPTAIKSRRNTNIVRVDAQKSSRASFSATIIPSQIFLTEGDEDRETKGRAYRALQHFAV
jgi:hypothetical protein